MKPQICPICRGQQVVPAGFYSQLTTINTTPVTCRSCNGKGFITTSDFSTSGYLNVDNGEYNPEPQVIVTEKPDSFVRIEKTNDFLNKKHDIPYIICAAIWFKDGKKYTHQPKNVDTGIVVCGRRHHNCFLTAYELNGGKKIEGLNEVNERAVSGFITSDDRFVDRKEAGEIAFKAKQTDKLINYLFSEDLY